MKKIISLTLVLIMSLSCFSLISFATETEQVDHLTEVPEGYAGVYTIEDLYCIRNDLAANYILMNNIDLTEATAEGGDWDFYGNGWNPIGSNDVYGNTPFTGVFNGNGYVIKGLRIEINTIPTDTDDMYLGLFSVISGTVKNLIVDGKINVNIKRGNHTFSGGISACCRLGGIIENCTNRVNISITNQYYSEYYKVHVGGIVGDNAGLISQCKNVADLYSYVYFSGSYTNPAVASAGGICASSTSTASEVYCCFNTGKITAYNGAEDNASSRASGIAIGGKISNCYNSGQISSRQTAYGIGGSDCSYSYNVGLVSGNSTYAISNGSITRGYYLAGTGGDSFGATSLTQVQMKLRSMYVDWNFDDIWTIDGRDDYFYPELQKVPLVLPEDLIHKHSYESIVTEATCFEEGFTTYSCGCGDSYIDNYTDKIPHTYTSKITTQPTHIREGVETFSCYCGDSYMKSIAKLENHSHNALVTQPTCTTKGYTTYICECGDIYVSDYIGVIEHNYSATVSRPATHLSEGIRVYTCTYCGDNYNETIPMTKAHKYIASVTAPTCISKGYTTYTCECTDSYIDNYTNTIDHQYTSKITIQPTHLKDGVETFTCICGDSYTETIEKISKHSYTSKVMVQPTHLKDGVKIFTCECGDSYTEVVAKVKEHVYIAEVTTEPTHTNDGVKTFYCECGFSYSETLAKTTEHSYISEITTPATHITEGVKTFTCECGDHYDEAIAKTKEHSYTSTLVNSTCTDQGYTLNECECGDSYKTNYLAKIDHVDSNSDGVCDDCGYDLAENCSCNCHSGGIKGLIFRIILFFQKFFRTNQICEGCGVRHY